MGLLTVLVDHAKDLMAADRNGYSDPYAQFILNGAKVFKSSVQKKTLNPKWMERFEVEIVQFFFPLNVPSESSCFEFISLHFFRILQPPAIKSECGILRPCLRLGSSWDK
jgi:hypothetical protein